MFDFYYELAKGGWVMWPIGFVSVVALGLFLERVITLRRTNVFPAAVVHRVRELILARRFSEALTVCQQNGSSIALIISAGLIRQGEPRIRIKEAVEEKGRAEAGRLDRFIEVLGTIAAIAPLLGLLGTVLGMIDVFRIVDNFTTKNPGAPVDPGLLATGIWKALITTAAGLVVAIPTFVGYKFLNSRINRMILDMEESASDITDLFIRIQEGDANLTAAEPSHQPGPQGDDGADKGGDAVSKSEDEDDSKDDKDDSKAAEEPRG